MSETATSPSTSSPVWNFDKTTAFPITIPQGKARPTVYVHLSPYTALELKDILKKAVSGYKREKRDVEIVKEDAAIYTPLLDAHFVKMSNASGTPEEQRAWLNKHPELKTGIVELTFGGLQSEQIEESEDEDEMLDISMELSGSVPVYQDIYNETSDEVVRVDMVHKYIQPSEQQYREYRSARRSKFLRKNALWTVTEQHSTLEKLYDSVVQSIDGGFVDNKPCVLATKATWIGFVPLWHKLWIVDRIFGEIVEKNA